MRTTSQTILSIAIALLLATFAFAACGGDGDEEGSGEAQDTPGATDTPDVGDANPPGVSKPSDLKIAYFSAAANNTYLQAGIQAAKDGAEKIGASVEIFDGKFDPGEQFNQIQTAITSGRFNAFIVEANDGRQVCNVLKRAAEEQKILIAVVNQPLCGDPTYTPGTVTFVGGQTRDVYDNFVEFILKDNPQGGEVAIITGPSLNANTNNMNAAWNAVKDANPEFKLVANQKTDYSTPQANRAAEDILQANPGLDMIISNYSGMTQGVVQAIKRAGKTDRIRVYDMGGNEWAIDAVKRGDVRMTLMFLPYEEVLRAVEALAARVQGEEVSRFINLTKDPRLPGTPFVTRENVAKFKAQY